MATLLLMQHAASASWMMQMCYAVCAICVYGDKSGGLMLELQYCKCNMYAVNVASVRSLVRDTRCLCKPVCKGCVLGNEQPMVNVAHCPCVYGLKPYAFVRVVCDYE